MGVSSVSRLGFSSAAVGVVLGAGVLGLAMGEEPEGGVVGAEGVVVGGGGRVLVGGGKAVVGVEELGEAGGVVGGVGGLVEEAVGGDGEGQGEEEG